MSPETPLRAAIYLRISLDHEMDGLAIERQREDCQKIIRDRGWTEVKPHYVDPSISATDRTKVRPQYNQMVQDYQDGKFEAIVCWDLDRLTRQPRQLEDWIEAAETRGLKLVSVTGDVDLTNEQGIIVAGIKVQLARAEMMRKAARQSRAQRQRAEKGRAPKGMRPFGYTVQGEVIPAEAKIVRAIFRSFAPIDPQKPSSSLRAIAASLSGSPEKIRGLPKTQSHSRTVMLERNEVRRAEKLKERDVPEDRPWSASTVLGILRNPRYMGWSTYTPKQTLANGDRRRSWRASILKGDDGNPVKAQWKPIIIDVAQWQAVQDKLDLDERVTNRSGSTERKHIGSGLFLCDECGHSVRSHSTGYRCVACKIMRRRNNVDAMVVSTVAARLGKPDVQKLLVNADAPRVRAIAALIESERSDIARAWQDYRAKRIPGEGYQEIHDEAQRNIAVLEAERLKLTAGAAVAGVMGAQDPRAAWEALYELHDDPIGVTVPSEHLAVVRAVINTLYEVRLARQPRGRKGIHDLDGQPTVKLKPR